MRTRTSSITDELLKVRMGGTGALYATEQMIDYDYSIDSADDKRRENYIKLIKTSIKDLKGFMEKFNNRDFTNFVVKLERELLKDLEEQLYYEELSDNIRHKMKSHIIFSRERLAEESNEVDNGVIDKVFRGLK
ncbi:MAG: hypothetical protein ACRC8M_13845 [Cetobacterium sp.]|uniref:hypothetical protein n=1 Tax=Cetobacterium sp. TaxID=2071632 RepID=UPI003F3A96CF